MVTRWLLEHSLGQFSFKLMLGLYLSPQGEQSKSRDRTKSTLEGVLVGERLAYIKRVARDRAKRIVFVILAVALATLLVTLIPGDLKVGGAEVRSLVYYIAALGGFIVLIIVYRLTISYNIIFRFMTLLRRLDENHREWQHLFLNLNAPPDRR
jgi:hypothetical protein